LESFWTNKYVDVNDVLVELSFEFIPVSS